MIVDCSAYGPGSGVPRRDSDAYTPGPWAIYASSVADQAERSWMKGVTIYSEPTGKRIADTCWLNSSNDHNARLIVAAPDMLAALKKAVGLLNAWPTPMDGALQQSINGIHAAIAKDARHEWATHPIAGHAIDQGLCQPSEGRSEHGGPDRPHQPRHHRALHL